MNRRNLNNKDLNNLYAGNKNNLSNTNFKKNYRMNDLKNEIDINNDPNPFNHYLPLNSNNDISNFNRVFTENLSVIPRINTLNTNNTLHNNINDNILKENIIEYTINIDSIDRDIERYKSPYYFIVNFNANAPTIVKTSNYINGNLQSESHYFKGTPTPLINKEFRNVKYVRLNCVILPQYGNIKEKCDTYVLDNDNKLIDDRFLTVVIDEFNDLDSRTFSTSDTSDRLSQLDNSSITSPKPFCQVYPERIYGKYFYYGDIVSGERTYKDSQLGNISKMTIRLYDSCGTPLKIDNLFNECEIIRNNICLDNIRHPLNKIHQVFFSFTFGVVENELSTITKYEK